MGIVIKHWDKCKLRTALEWVVFTSSRTARLVLRCSTLERIGSDFSLNLRVTGELTFCPKPGAIDKG